MAIGDDLGIAASGGEIRLRADGKILSVPTTPGEGADLVAENLSRAVERAGLAAIVSPNARIGPGVAHSVDVSIRRKDGTLLAVDTIPGAPLSTDPTLSVRIGSIDVSDGLQHFTDVDAMAGTLEERTLLKAIDDSDPATVEVVVVPLFAGGGRIGESFIGSDLSSVRNVVLLDRAGIRARKSSLTLAHELGHVFSISRATPTTTASTRPRCSWIRTRPMRPRSAPAASRSTSARAPCARQAPRPGCRS